MATDTQSTTPPEDIEVKFAMADADAKRAVGEFALGEPVKQRRIYFFDVDPPSLAPRLILRAREHVAGKGHHDATVKLRDPLAASAPAKWLQAPANGEREDDLVVGKDAVASLSLSRKFDDGEIAAVLAGTDGLKKLFTDAQKTFLIIYAGGEPDWKHFSVWGPVAADSWKFQPKGFPQELEVERWSAGKSAVLEFSAKVPPDQAASLAETLGSFMKGKGFATDPETKTHFVFANLSPRKLN